MKCYRGERLVNPKCHLDFVLMDDLMRSLPERSCSECKEAVNFYPLPTANPGPGRTFDKASVVVVKR